MNALSAAGEVGLVETSAGTVRTGRLVTAAAVAHSLGPKAIEPRVGRAGDAGRLTPSGVIAWVRILRVVRRCA